MSTSSVNAVENKNMNAPDKSTHLVNTTDSLILGKK